LCLTRNAVLYVNESFGLAYWTTAQMAQISIPRRKWRGNGILAKMLLCRNRNHKPWDQQVERGLDKTGEEWARKQWHAGDAAAP